MFCWQLSLGCHCLRELNGQVFFLYAVDLNNASTEEQDRAILSNTDSSFYPLSTHWITCESTTYRPHSNECGPLSLLAATILALRPHPSSNILTPLMHSNLAQISRTWVATTILNGRVEKDAIQHFLQLPTPTIPGPVEAPSHPHSLINWGSSRPQTKREF
jgi:hypothetical protein